MPQSPSEEEKERFLAYIREGDDRSTAAWRINPDYTGSMFRRLCSPRSKNYDADFAAAFDEAVEERGPLDPSRQKVFPTTGRGGSSTTSSGFTKADHLTEDQLDRFLEKLRDGERKATAANELDPPTSITQIHRRASRDPEFAKDLREAEEEGYNAYAESLRAESARQAFAGDYRALRDQMIMHLPEAREALTTSRHEVGGLDGAAIRLLAERHFSDLPPEMLDEMIRTLEEKELGGSKELEPGS